MNFKDLHSQEDPFLMANVWDVASAKIAKSLNFKAIGTSSGAIATMLGYGDGEEISFHELKYIVERIVKCVDLPLSVDIESGYGSGVEEIIAIISELSELGIVGINIEDSKVRNGQRSLTDSLYFSKMLKAIASRFNSDGKNIFINVRTDTFLLSMENAAEETVLRAKQYQKAGADGLFVPCIENKADVEKITKATDLPLNVMCMPDLPDFHILKSLGVKRISMGNFVFNKMTDELRNTLEEIRSNQNFKSLF
ncbi:isocitrate lyase/PEP mutase family protein [Poritiphilus flavus]|uniref:Isocitrate lyase/phosphoenolpyruvate mutase family protein n=1 Tax=Poritiphilus flavus TaxID=2697053 RepID=A0A6L9EED8_9FLAO|nr:isocitrate lyase/phosphoenolpyruvate mutase family protein [Poritiphilus flavus]NAS13011.1 isocitrate lyase/phosphoenolpyruvate mutase family protein [Poritiphilus flavus]